MPDYVWCVQLICDNAYKVSDRVFAGSIFSTLEKAIEHIENILKNEHQEYCECNESESFEDCRCYDVFSVEDIKEVQTNWHEYIICAKDNEEWLVISKNELS